MSKISKTSKVLISILIIFAAPVILIFAFVQDFGNILINERLVFASIVTAVIGFGLLMYSIFSRK